MKKCNLKKTKLSSLWGQEVILKSLRPNFVFHLVFKSYNTRLSFVFGFNEIWTSIILWPRQPQKMLSGFFRKLCFWNQCIPKKNIKVTQCRGPALAMHIFNFPSRRAPIITKTYLHWRMLTCFSYINDQFASDNVLGGTVCISHSWAKFKIILVGKLGRKLYYFMAKFQGSGFSFQSLNQNIKVVVFPSNFWFQKFKVQALLL